MKSILLTSTALVAFAGAAAADGHTNIGFALGGTLGYNSEEIGDNDGFYWNIDLSTTATAALDNGLTAGASFDLEILDEEKGVTTGQGQVVTSEDFVLSLTSDTASMFFGDTKVATSQHWKSAGDMESDGFTTDTDSNVLRGDVSMFGANASISYIWDDSANEAEQLSVGVSGSFGAFSVAAGYQEQSDFVDGEDDYNGSEIYGISVGGTFAGATVTAAYAVDSNNGDDQSENAQQSAGIELAYPFGPVTATVYYVMETQDDGGDLDPNYGVTVAYVDNGISVTAKYRDEQGRPEYNVDASYDLGNGLSVIGGIENEDDVDVDYYIGATYDLGGGASVLMTYAEDENDNTEDEIGAGDYQDGVTVQVSFAF